MSSTYETLFTNIATAIRSKDGISTLMSPSDFPTRLNALSIGNNSKVNITANDYSSSTYKSSCYITCTTSEGYTDTVYGTFSSSGDTGIVSFTLKYVGTYVFHYTCLEGSTEYNHTRSISNTQNGLTFNEEVEYITIDPTKSSFTEAEFIYICQKGWQSRMTIGALITLANSYQNTWEVIGVNHDGTSGTVDIMSHTNINAMKYCSYTTNPIYSGSYLHTFCNSTVPNAFTNATTKSLIKTMEVVYYKNQYKTFYTLSGQKGKALSATEVGYSGSGAPNEGTSYGLSSYLYRSGASSYVWTRTAQGGATVVSSSGIWCAVKDSSTSVISMGTYDCYENTFATLPVLRF